MPIPKELIDPEADKVVRRLRRYGHTAYLVGGCVRDLILGRNPKDWDVATSATPTEIKDLFRNCRIIGRRFRLAHVFFGSKIIETSTFRANPREGAGPDDADELLIRRDNVFGTAEEDARRRDFTMNGLFYDLEAGEVIDYVGGLADLEARVIRVIGDPDIRFREDPVRILRAVKFAARLGLGIEPETYRAIVTHRSEIVKCPAPRVLEEIYRLLREGAGRRSMELLLETGVAAAIVPELAWMFGGMEGLTAAGGQPPIRAPGMPDDIARIRRAQAWRVLEELDSIGKQLSHASAPPSGGGTPHPTNALVLAAVVAPFLPDLAAGDDESARDQFILIEHVLGPVAARLRASRRDAERARHILLAQRRLAPSKRKRMRPMALVRRDFFGEALGLYELMARASGTVGDEISRWKALWARSSGSPMAGGDDDGELGECGGYPAGDGEPGESGADADRPRRRRRRGGRRRRRGAGGAGGMPDDAGDSGELVAQPRSGSARSET